MFRVVRISVRIVNEIDWSSLAEFDVLDPTKTLVGQLQTKYMVWLA